MILDLIQKLNNDQKITLSYSVIALCVLFYFRFIHPPPKGR